MTYETSNPSSLPLVRRCQAHTVDGESCGAPAVTGMNVCYKHGGAEGSGRPCSTARYTTRLPARLQERYEAFVGRPDYVALKEQIALLETRIEDLKERLCVLDSPDSRAYALTVIEELIADAQEAVDWPKFESTLQELHEFLCEKKREDEVWKNIEITSENLRRLKETEVKRMVAANQVLTVTESYNLILRVAMLFEDYIEDPVVRAKAVRECHELLNRKGGKTLPAEVIVNGGRQ